MKSPSKNKNENITIDLLNESRQTANDALDLSAKNLPENILSDIARVRTNALNQGYATVVSKSSIVDTWLTWLFNPMVNLGIPVVAAVIIAVLVDNASVESIPELPLVMMATEVPIEDFALLEDLEFVTWLAENEQSALL